MLRCSRKTARAVWSISKLLNSYGMTVLDPASVGLKDEDWREVVKRNIDWLVRSDVVVAVCTEPSTGMGGELVTAKNMGKPVLVFDGGATSVWARWCARMVTRDMNTLVLAVAYKTWDTPLA